MELKSCRGFWGKHVPSVFIHQPPPLHLGFLLPLNIFGLKELILFFTQFLFGWSSPKAHGDPITRPLIDIKKWKPRRLSLSTAVSQQNLTPQFNFNLFYLILFSSAFKPFCHFFLFSRDGCELPPRRRHHHCSGYTYSWNQKVKRKFDLIFLLESFVYTPGPPWWNLRIQV